MIGGMTMARARDYSQGSYVTVLSKEQMIKLLSTKSKPYNAKAEAKKARIELRKQGLKV